MEELNKAINYLKQAVGLCQIPKEQWSDADCRLLLEIRQFIKQQEGETESCDKMKEK
jgi:hypothetical protein